MSEQEPTKKYPFEHRDWHEAYFDFASNPMDQRTDPQFSEAEGCTLNALQQWKKKYKTIIDQEVETRRQQAVPAIRIRLWKALDALVEGNVKAIELAFKLIGDLNTVQNHEHAINYMSPDEKRAKLVELMAIANAKLGVAPKE